MLLWSLYLRRSQRVSACSEDVTVLQDCPVTLSSPSPAPITLIQKSALGVGSGREVVGFSSPEWRGVREGRVVRVLGGRGSCDGAAAKHRMYDWRHARKALKDTLDTEYTQTQDKIHTENEEHMHRMEKRNELSTCKTTASWCVCAPGKWECGEKVDHFYICVERKSRRNQTQCLHNSIWCLSLVGTSRLLVN